MASKISFGEQKAAALANKSGVRMERGSFMYKPVWKVKTRRFRKAFFEDGTLAYHLPGTGVRGRKKRAKKSPKAPRAFCGMCKESMLEEYLDHYGHCPSCAKRARGEGLW